MAYQKLQANRAAAVTPSNIDTIKDPMGGEFNNGCVLYIGGAGNVRVLTAGQDDVTFTGVNAGTFLPVQVIRVYSTNTTATTILALW